MARFATLHVQLVRAGGATRRPRRPGRSRLLIVAATVAALSVALTPAAVADSSGSTTGTIYASQPASSVYSVQVSPASVVFCSKATPLTYPTGVCTAGPVTITNTGAAGHIDETGADAVPADAGTSWKLTRSATGVDQYLLQTQGSVPTTLTNSPQCDLAFGNSGAPGASGAPGGPFTCAGAAADATSVEVLHLVGPSKSTDTSATFTTTITWTAGP